MKKWLWIFFGLILLGLVGIILSQEFESTRGCKSFCAGTCEKSFFGLIYFVDNRQVMGCHADLIEIPINCSNVAQSSLQRCCDTWTIQNNVSIVDCAGEWKIENDSCIWFCG